MPVLEPQEDTTHLLNHPEADRRLGDYLQTSGSVGTVYWKSQNNYRIHAAGREINCSLSSLLRKQLVYPTADPNSRRPVVQAVKAIDEVDPVAIGDRVRYLPAGINSGRIVEILPRRNELTRRDPGKKPLKQVIAANVDQVIPVIAAAQPAPTWNLLDRYLVSAAWANIPVILCFTKLDLLVDPQVEAGIFEYERLGYPVIRTSTVDGRGLEELHEILAGRLSVFVGKSGVGKSSLLNALQPGLGLRVSQVSRATGKGRHTTTHLEMFPLGEDYASGYVVDTPGMREFALGELEFNELALLFPELRPYVGYCRFGLDCSHIHEPDCAILDAVQTGRISQRRYMSYRKMLEG